VGAVYDFSGRTAIVTGAGRGIGAALAGRFAEAGAAVVAVDREDAELEDAARAIGAIAVGTDVSKTADVERAVSTALRRTGRVDVLVNNAGILYEEMLWRVADEDWDSVLATRLGATFRFTRACVPHFRARSFGRVINMTSFTGVHGNAGYAPHAAAQAGVIGFTKAAAKELAPYGVTVNAIAPNAEAGLFESMPSDERSAVQARVPLGRFAQPWEVSAAASFLASEEATYVTGVVLAVDGGLSM
jgi:3-oxoacyl-[acyl-carrier protein] reductase